MKSSRACCQCFWSCVCCSPHFLSASILCFCNKQTLKYIKTHVVPSRCLNSCVCYIKMLVIFPPTCELKDMTNVSKDSPALQIPHIPVWINTQEQIVHQCCYSGTFLLSLSWLFLVNAACCCTSALTVCSSGRCFGSLLNVWQPHPGHNMHLQHLSIKRNFCRAAQDQRINRTTWHRRGKLNKDLNCIATFYSLITEECPSVITACPPTQFHFILWKASKDKRKRLKKNEIMN